jgi:hypothetical protein
MNPHKVLGLPPSATLGDAEDAYRRLLRQYHPDLHQHDGADVLANAEQQTRALNAAIRQLRAGRPTRVTAAPGAAPSDGPGAGDRGGAADGPAWDPFDAAPWDTAGPVADDPPAVACPLCGEWFSTAPSLKAHLIRHHELRLDRRRRSRRSPRRRPSLPVWVLVPMNAMTALVVAAAADSLSHDTALAAWIFALTMAPSVIRLFSQD